ncbi:hypothetical protein KKG52_00375 [Patescibacteria group bacterium]|nr:hypothetical protein [Patescibacteria group bacterium]
MARDKNLVVSLEQVYSKSPSLPVSIRELIVVIAPWLALVLGVVGVFGSLAAFGITSFLSPFIALGAGLGMSGGYVLVSVLGIVQSVLMLFAFSSLLKRKYAGWYLIFWSEFLSVISAVILFSLSGIIVALIGFYFLFQIKEYYK